MTEKTTPGTGAAPQQDAGFRSWHFYVLLAMVAATVGVMLTRDTHPAALLLLSAAIIAAGLAGVALHGALAGFAGRREDEGGPLRESDREVLEREKALTLRSIKELEFDRAMGKVSESDFDEIGGRLRARALLLMQQLEELDAAPPVRTPVVRPAPGPAPGPLPAARPSAAAAVSDAACPGCGTVNDEDARFCKQCGATLAA